jgi:predicted RNA-binding protein YlxR (DUF448 family)
MAKKPQRRKHVPHRTCVACRAVRPKRELVRAVRTPDGEILVDETGKLNGRGAYLCRQKSCWDEALARGDIDRALKTRVRGESRAALRAYAEGLPLTIEPPSEPQPAESKG